MKKKTFKAALTATIPIFIGFLFIGLAYGVYMNAKGFNYIYCTLMSIIVCAGALQFVGVELLVSAFNPVYAFIMSVMINARHIFYSISMLDKYKDTGLKKPIMIFALCDETFSINISAKISDDMDEKLYYFYVTCIVFFYWVFSSFVGGVLGGFVNINVTGIDFILTALFFVTFINQLIESKQYMPSLIGLISSFICLIVFGRDNFIIPSMIVILIILTVFRNKFDKGEAGEVENDI
ncbi:AzlC family ABC transporter permease [Intestinibacter sp.]|uniref:AzlC family ABC transporter permease n=1 Tax=Intestinibacter sp. TaxID=1965304 RepID=UPI002A753CE7|nr:AzlC family ABC transporter permease [Intestinibacter sp.]MDY2735675.1 AzlC family ABC transporter permease [Intestinibacter sp.]MDY4574724.1 AzlC family ABC transporter permease [Intestinibacter sp.]